jgi:hypothetical protein
LTGTNPADVQQAIQQIALQTAQQEGGQVMFFRLFRK